VGEVKRWIKTQIPSCSYNAPEYVLASDYDVKAAECERLAAALRSISTGAKRYWREGDDAYQFAILADAGLSAVPSDSPADVKSEPLCPRCHGQARTAMYRPSRGDYEMAPCIECSGTGRASPTNSVPQLDLTKPVPTKAESASYTKKIIKVTL
jgi:hypothetical protein